MYRCGEWNNLTGGLVNAGCRLLGTELMMLKAPAALLLIALSFSGSVGCKNAKPATKNSIDTGVATINLSAVTKSNQTQTFREVTRASLLPKAVLDQFGGMADPGQPFNSTDIGNELPMQQLVVAAVSDQYAS